MKEFKSFIKSLKTNIYDSDFSRDLIELAEKSSEFKNDVLEYCKKNRIKPLTEYSQKEAVAIFQALSKFCCERTLYYGLAEEGDGEIYTY